MKVQVGRITDQILLIPFCPGGSLDEENTENSVKGKLQKELDLQHLEEKSEKGLKSFIPWIDADPYTQGLSKTVGGFTYNSCSARGFGFV